MLKEEERSVKVFASRVANSAWSLAVDVFLSHIEGFFLNKRALVIAVMGCQGGGDCAPLSYFCSRCFSSLGLSSFIFFLVM